MTSVRPPDPIQQPESAEPPADANAGFTLVPRSGSLFVVRWVRNDGKVVKHRYYRRRADAEAFALRLSQGGWYVEMFRADTTWTGVDWWRR